MPEGPNGEKRPADALGLAVFLLVYFYNPASRFASDGGSQEPSATVAPSP
jgi:hypothetical protein